MASIRQFFLRLVSLFRHGRAEDELAREIDAHLALLEDEFIAKGMTPPMRSSRPGARSAASIRRRSISAMRDRSAGSPICRATCRYAMRSLRKNQAFTIAAVLTLSIGIGATTAIYSVVDTVLLRPLPFAGSDRLVAITEPERPRTMRGINYQEFLEWRSRTTTLRGHGRATRSIRR